MGDRVAPRAGGIVEKRKISYSFCHILPVFFAGFPLRLSLLSGPEFG
jgi:hypothetical protein